MSALNIISWVAVTLTWGCALFSMILTGRMIRDRLRSKQKAILLLRAYHMLKLWKDTGDMPNGDLDPYKWLSEAHDAIYEKDGEVKYP